MKEIDVKSIGKDGYALKLASALLALRAIVDEAIDAHEENEKQIAQLHLLRTDMEHMMCDEYDPDPVKDALVQQKVAKQYREVQRRRRELITENLALEHIICNEEFVYGMDDIAEAITGQLQYIDHAHYTPKSTLFRED